MQKVVQDLRNTATREELDDALRDVCRMIGARYYALTRHVDCISAGPPAFRLHNYPKIWVERFDRRKLASTDPVHRASHGTLTGFLWRDVPQMIVLTPEDWAIFDEAREHGLGDGFTVPAHIPGESLGSCSFATATGEELSPDVLPFAHLAGQYAYEATRRMSQRRPYCTRVRLTVRQVECVRWVGRGKTDWEIGRILGVSNTTIVEHLRHARERYEAPTRAVLPVRALWDGALSFPDMLPAFHPQNME